MIEKYLCFRPNYGFCFYNPTEDSLTYTQEIGEAAEADIASWRQVMADHNVSNYATTPAEVYVHRLRSQLTAVVSRDYLRDAMNVIIDEVEQSRHYPHQAILRVKHVCKAAKAGEPIPYVKQQEEV